MSDEVDTAVGERPATENVIDALNNKRAALNEARERYATARNMRDEGAMAHLSAKIDALKNTIIPELERDAQVVVEATGRKAAEERLLGIRRAYGSAVATYGEDDKRVQQAVAELSEAITTLNGRARKLEALSAEAAALADRFSLAIPKLTMPPEPQNVALALPTLWEYKVVRPSFEACEHNLRQRRDYAEIGGTSGYNIIMTAGLRPFRPLTEREREVLEDTAEERNSDPVLAQAATEANALGKLGVPGGHIFRG